MEYEEEFQSGNLITQEPADRPILRTASLTPERKTIKTEQSLDAAIQLGEALRKNKQLRFRNTNTSLPVLCDEDCSTNKHRNKRCHPRKAPRSQQKACDSKTCVTFKTDRSPVARSTSTSFDTRHRASKANTSVSMRRRRTRKPLICPLRIAELATPTKRHCISTWRDRNAMLPAHMLERLKRNVMNQTVLATITDADTCFQIHRKDRNNRASSMTSPTRSDSRCRIPKKSRMESKEMDDMRLMSAIFAHRVAAELIKPMNVYLPKELTKLAVNVSTAVKELIQNRRICADYVYDTDLLKEMSGKITLWISDVLACAEYKLLEDELRVIKTRENKISKEGDLVTLIDQYVRWQMREGDQDLEEDEGPALDALDILVDNVLDICLPENVSTEDSILKNDQQSLPEINESETKNENLSDEGHDSQVIEPPNISNGTEVYDMPKHNKENPDTDGTESEYGSPDEVESDTSVADNSDPEGNIKVSDDDDEPLRKKVKFSQNEGGGGSETGGGGSETGGNGESRGNGEAGGNGKSGGYRKTEGYGASSNRRGFSASGRAISNESLSRWPNYSHSATFIRSDIVFQPPNCSILSIVDELWPDDNIPTLKPSASVSKSITSLGDIKEFDDEIDLFDYRSKSNNNSGNSEDMKALLEQDHGKSAASTSSERSFMIQKDNEDSNTSDSQRTQTNEPNLLLKVTPSKLLNDLHTLIKNEAEQIKEKQIKQVNYIADADSIGKGDHNDTQNANQSDNDGTTDVERNPIVLGIKEKIKRETKFDYRVYPQTAPSWAITTSDDSLPVTRKRQTEKDQYFKFSPAARLGPSELRKWCKELENTLTHLRHWNKWLDSICRNIVYMQEETAMTKKLGSRYVKQVLKEWRRFKKSIDRDAVFWRKLYQTTFKTLYKYPTRSQDTSRAIVNKEIVSKKSLSKPMSRIEGMSAMLHRSDTSRAIVNKEIVSKKSLSKSMLSIEGMSTMLHRSIVSTEHIVRCNCRTLTSNKNYQSTNKLPKQ